MRNAIIAARLTFPVAQIVSNEVVAGSGVPYGVFVDAEDRLVSALHPVPTSGDAVDRRLAPRRRRSVDAFPDDLDELAAQFFMRFRPAAKA